ncbi:hypothetical protein Chor_005667 [Crotalus horridus]
MLAESSDMKSPRIKREEKEETEEKEKRGEMEKEKGKGKGKGEEEEEGEGGEGDRWRRKGENEKGRRGKKKEEESDGGGEEGEGDRWRRKGGEGEGRERRRRQIEKEKREKEKEKKQDEEKEMEKERGKRVSVSGIEIGLTQQDSSSIRFQRANTTDSLRSPTQFKSRCGLDAILSVPREKKGLWAQKVLVNETVSGFIGTDVVLHCNLVKINHTRITQVTWQKGSNGSKQNVAIYNPVMGVSILPPYEERVVFQSPSITDGTIKLSNLQLDDEGIYISKPVNRMEGTSRPLIARAGMTEKILVATCISSNGKPPSTVTWDTKLKGEAEFQEIRNENGTITVISRYRLLPSREAHQQQLKCVVNYQFERFTQSMTLNVLYEPEVRIDGFDSNWYLNRKDVKLTCISDANPPAMEYQWKLLNGSLPDSAEIQNSTLFFKGPVTYSLSATYICEATNTIGTRSGQVEVNVTACLEFSHLLCSSGKKAMESGGIF